MNQPPSESTQWKPSTASLPYFLEPTLAGEPVAVRTRLARMGNKSFTLVQQLVDTATGRVKCSCQVVMVYIDLAAGKPAPVPTDWRQAMEAYDGPL